MNREHLKAALQRFKNATNELSRAWEGYSDGMVGYPDYLPSFDEFAINVMDMSVVEHEPLPELPPVGTILRARHDLDCGQRASLWPEGWTGELVSLDGEYVHVQAHRYIAELAEWDNCRVIGVDDGVNAYENTYGHDPEDGAPRDRLIALALLADFEVC